MWNLINHWVHSRNLTLQLIKVKGHSANFLNDKADSLARSGLSSPSFCISPFDIKFNTVATPCFSYNRVIIESDSRRFTNSVQQAQFFESFISLNRFSTLAQSHNNNLLNWEATWSCLHFSNESKLFTSFEQNASFTLATRLLLDELPLMAKLQLQKPNVYLQDWNCALCGLDKQTWAHLWVCPALTLKFEALRDVTLTTIIRLLAESVDPPASGLSTRSRDSLTGLSCWTLPNSSASRLDFNHLLRGFIPSSLFNLIKSVVGTSDRTNNIIGETISAAQQVFKLDIWQHHLSIMHEFEKVKGISTKIKHSPASTRDNTHVSFSRSPPYPLSTLNRWRS